MITGKSAIYFMLSNPIKHVKSPGMFNKLFAEEGIDAIMTPVSFDPADFDAAWRYFKAMTNLKGMIISVPFKAQAAAAADILNPRAERVGTANAIIRDADGRLRADNFDGAGFLEGMRRSGHDLESKTVLLVGAGGAGGSIGFCIAEAGAASLTICDIDSDRAQNLGKRIAATFPACQVRTGAPDPTGHHVVVNATPIGLKPGDPLPLQVERLTPDMTVVDIIMDPRETALLKHAKSIGCRIQYGQPMMDCQMELLADFLQVRPKGDQL
ncbi:shikimate dehydrogenase [Falsochrobactrum sp. TDYN1]|uniref:Shikimate dehydrogenase n=1 Tax=Falsochrobactrum tianjinense TaxID=2706015 RepID=A0A949PR82_9HYPH|nr:shikimate dehydrogenase [Falsochrobactrum sp. TDYN1]MBV2143405.1 shikimate dehydrogenase [Falsochrobactrum sp. TDYN1]